MIILERGNYKLNDWFLDVECTGKHWIQKHRPCHSKIRLEDGDIVKRVSRDLWSGARTLSYGFICEECHCFTEIEGKDIPKEIKDWCEQVASKGSDEYDDLTQKGKELSQFL